MLDKLPGTRVGLRDRALLLVGFAGAFRRAELVSLDLGDVEFSSAGLLVTLRRSKTDQEGKSRCLGIPFGSSEGPVQYAPSRPGSRRRVFRRVRSQTGHRSADMVRKYIREGSLFRENAQP